MAETELHRLTRLRDWKRAKKRLSNHPSDASRSNSRDETVLHYASAYGAPIEYFRQLLSVNADGVSSPNENGMLPLHYAAYWGANVDVIRLLLRKYVRGAQERDKSGWTPVSLAWSVQVFPNPRAEDVDGENRRVARNLELMERVCPLPDDPPSSDSEEFGGGNKLGGELGEWWEKMELLLRATYHGTVSTPLPNRRKWRVVHAIAGVQCNPRLMRFALRLHPSQAAERDEDGLLPVHIASRRTCLYRIERPVGRDREGDGVKEGGDVVSEGSGVVEDAPAPEAATFNGHDDDDAIDADADEEDLALHGDEPRGEDGDDDGTERVEERVGRDEGRRRRAVAAAVRHAPRRDDSDHVSRENARERRRRRRRRHLRRRVERRRRRIEDSDDEEESVRVDMDVDVVEEEEAPEEDGADLVDTDEEEGGHEGGIAEHRQRVRDFEPVVADETGTDDDGESSSETASSSSSSSSSSSKRSSKSGVDDSVCWDPRNDPTRTPMETILDPLLDLYPKAASAPRPDGTLPLHLMLECGRAWYSGIARTLREEPRSLVTRDVNTHLYPFQLAAVGHAPSTPDAELPSPQSGRRGGGRRKRKREGRRKDRRGRGRGRGSSSSSAASGRGDVEPDLTTVFELLRASPELVRSGVGRGSRQRRRSRRLLARS